MKIGRIIGLKFHPILLMLTLTLFSSCSENNSTGTNDHENLPKISAFFEAESPSFLPGELPFIKVEDYDLESEVYSAKLDGEENIELAVIDSLNSLTFIVPEREPGLHNLEIEMEGQKIDLEFEIEEYEPIENPEQYTLHIINEFETNFEKILRGSNDEEVLKIIREKKTELTLFHSEFIALPEDEKKMIARLVHSSINDLINSANGDVANKFIKKNSECDENYIDELIVKIVTSGITIDAAIKTASVLGAVGTTLAFGPAGGLFAGAAIYYAFNKYIDYRMEVTECTYEKASILLEDLKNQNKSKNKSIDFEHALTKGFTVKEIVDIPDKVKTVLSEFRETVKDILFLFRKVGEKI